MFRLLVRSVPDVYHTKSTDHRALGIAFPHASRLDELVRVRDQFRQAASAAPWVEGVRPRRRARPPGLNGLRVKRDRQRTRE
jgi:hypothetical protein